MSRDADDDAEGAYTVLRDVCRDKQRTLAELRDPEKRHIFTLPSGSEEELEALIPVADEYLEAHHGHSLLHSSVKDWLKELSYSSPSYVGETAAALRKLFSCGVPPVYLAAAHAVVDPPFASSRRGEVIESVADTLADERQRLGDPDMPHQVLAELIRERVEEARSRVYSSGRRKWMTGLADHSSALRKEARRR